MGQQVLHAPAVQESTFSVPLPVAVALPRSSVAPRSQGRMPSKFQTLRQIWGHYWTIRVTYISENSLRGDHALRELDSGEVVFTEMNPGPEVLFYF